MKKFLLITLLMAVPLGAAPSDDEGSDSEGVLSFSEVCVRGQRGYEYAGGLLRQMMVKKEMEDEAVGQLQVVASAMQEYSRSTVELYAKHWKEWEQATQDACDDPKKYASLFKRMAEEGVPLSLDIGKKFAQKMSSEGGKEGAEFLSNEVHSLYSSKEVQGALKDSLRVWYEQNAVVMSKARKLYLKKYADGVSEKEAKDDA